MPPSVGVILCLLLRVTGAELHDDIPPSTASSPSTAGPSSTLADDIPTWLPRSLEPLHYSVRIRPILIEENFTAPGEVIFTFKPIETTSRIVLNVRDLTIDESSTKVEEEVSPCDWIGFAVTNQTYDAEFETFQVGVNQSLKRGSLYRLTVRYVALIQDNLKGLYRCHYVDENNNKRWIAVTQLGPTNARALFPCMDEPRYKARFSLSIARQRQHKCVSNMPLKAIEPIEGEPEWMWDHFHTTVPMSTYLVALAVFDFERYGRGVMPDDTSQLQSAAVSGVLTNETDVVHGLYNVVGTASTNATDVVFGVWAPKGKVSRGAYAAHIGPRILQFYSEFFNLSFPLPKQDMIMVPQFHFSAMENWGLIMYRESALLVDPSHPESRHRVASTVAHELAHQWFGNLVTMKWWNDIWLNEGFATFISQVGVSFVEPQWNSEHLFVVENAKAVMKRDATASSHPVSQRIRKVSDIDHIFDSISYKKGASIIRMMSDFLGGQAFHKGLNAYLRKYRYKNAAQDDLWESLTEAAIREGVLYQNESVKEIMDTWTLQTGYPVVNLHRNYSFSTATVTQERFLLGGGRTQGNESLWWVPLWITSPSSASSAKANWLRGERQATLHGLPPRDQWVLVNAKQSGFYRVNYDERNWRLLKEAMEFLPELARAGLVDDALALADAGRLKYSIALGLVEHLPRDRASVSWVAALPWLRRLNHLTYNALPVGPAPALGAWARRVAASLYSLLPRYRNSSDPVEHKFYVLAKVWACEVGVKACSNETGEKLQQRVKTSEPDVRDRLVFDLCSPIEHSLKRDTQEKEFIENYELYDYETLQNIMRCLENETMLQRLLDRIFENNTTQHLPSAAFEDMIRTPNTNSAAMNFLKENSIDSKSRHRISFTDEDLLLAARFVRTKEQLSLMERILRDREEQEVQMALDQGRHNIWWMQTQSNHVAEAIQLLEH